MLVGVALYRIEPDLPTLIAPVMVAAFDGWVDAAGAASGATSHLATDAALVAAFDGDALFDYRSRRPVLDVVDGRLSDLAWPEISVRHVRADGRDLVVLAGAEPDLRWRAFSASVLELARHLGVTEWVSLGAVPAAVAHTRPVPVMVTASHDDALRNGETRGPTGLLRVPAAVLSVAELAVSSAGIPAVGFFAQVPPYAGSGYAAASVALLERIARHLSISLPLAELEATAQMEHRRFDAAVATDAETREMVSRLEAIAGEAEEQERLPTGDELAREIQRYLREQSDEGPTGPSFGE
jgi:hypothetical protein